MMIFISWLRSKRLTDPAPYRIFYDESIKWADKQYKMLCKNKQAACLRFELRGNKLVRSLQFIQGPYLSCLENLITDKFYDEECYMSPEYKEELVQKKYIVVKEYKHKWEAHKLTTIDCNRIRY